MQQAPPPLKKTHKIIEVLQRFTTLIFFADVYVLTSMSMIFIYFYFFLHFANLNLHDWMYIHQDDIKKKFGILPDYKRRRFLL